LTAFGGKDGRVARTIDGGVIHRVVGDVATFSVRFVSTSAARQWPERKLHSKVTRSVHDITCDMVTESFYRTHQNKCLTIEIRTKIFRAYTFCVPCCMFILVSFDAWSRFQQTT